MQVRLLEYQEDLRQKALPEHLLCVIMSPAVVKINVQPILEEIKFKQIKAFFFVFICKHVYVPNGGGRRMRREVVVDTTNHLITNFFCLFLSSILFYSFLCLISSVQKDVIQSNCVS